MHPPFVRRHASFRAPTRVHLCLLFLLSVCAAVYAEPPALLTVEDAVAATMRANPQVAAARADAAAARARQRAVRVLRNPRFTFSPLTGGPNVDQISLNQTLELNGAREARSRAALAELERTRAQNLTLVLDLVMQTRLAYYALEAARQQLTIAVELQEIARDLEELTRRQVDLGLRPGMDAMQAGVLRARAEQAVTNARGDEEIRALALKRLMGLPLDAPLGALVPLALGSPQDMRAIAVEAVRNRPELRSLRATRDAFLAQARLARLEGAPDLSVELRAERVTGSVQDPGVAVSISLPFIDYGSRRNNVRQALAAAEGQRWRLVDAERQVRQEVEQSVAQLTVARTSAEKLETVRDQSRRLLTANRAGFKAGLTTLLSFLEAERTFRAVQSDYVNALADWAMAGARLERAMGVGPVPPEFQWAEEQR